MISNITNAKKQDILVSIIIPVYNVEQYIEKCLNSIVNQTYKNLEIIIVNDGTPDNSMEIVNGFKDDRIVIINQKNQGLSAARNSGLEIAKGEFVYFIDSDDAIHLRTIEILANEVMKDNTVDIAVAGLRRVTTLDNEDELISKIVFSKMSGVDALLESVTTLVDYWIVAWGKLYRKSLFDDIRYPVGRIHEDEFTTYKLIHRARKISYTSLGLYYYLQRDNSIMATANYKRSLDYVDALIERNHYLMAHDIKRNVLYNDMSRALCCIYHLKKLPYWGGGKDKHMFADRYSRWKEVNLKQLNLPSRIIFLKYFICYLYRAKIKKQ